MTDEVEGKRGRLTVFVAAAPGAGKTYSMLEEGHRLKAEGRDVVIGLVETYGRPRTEALIQGLEVVPRRKVSYKGLALEEMDLEALIARKPEVVLIDEVYHTNAPGMPNAFRWEDVDDLRDAGIDVLTTMNIQHLESLKDVAEQIAGVTIRETIPDHLLEDADEIQLVDISPEALRKRMKHGNIYPERNIERALDGFFRPGNLAGLRELALGWLANSEADRLAEDEHLPTENVVVAVREPQQSQPLIRRAVRMSRRYRGRCTVITVLRPGEPLSEEMEASQKLAEALEAHFEAVSNDDPAAAIVEEVRTHNATQLLIGAPGGRFLERYRGSLVDELLEHLKDVDLHVIARLSSASEVPADPKTVIEAATTEPAADPIGTEGGERGYLRIYIGYAPGCGTTSTMLREGQRRAERGTSVIVGAAATYGLAVNEEALRGLTVIPPRTPPKRPGGSADMDLDAVMKSGAQVVCIDDLGYQNRDPQARHRYRFEEVEALRSAGFKVISTVHLRDMEAAASTVAAATGQETKGVVPDWVLRQATELELVDVPPAVLLKRLEHHDVPVSPERREQLRAIFTIDVLGRLRETALRLVATHTDARLLAYMEARGITAAWESMARVMAAVAPQPGLEPLIERAAAEAHRAEGKLVVVSVESGEETPDEAAEVRYRELTLRLGGQYVTLKSPKPAPALLDYAKHHHVTEIVLARGGHSEKTGATGSSIKRDIIRDASQIDVHVLREIAAQAESSGAGASPPAATSSEEAAAELAPASAGGSPGASTDADQK
ncbi:MAG: two-component system, OmpR family, sensor histidine kinase KdpD [Chloroflexota bacterium]|jgi:two-component system sensor histidine kinase KdpD|nr:two-component system, OmpR family, sensor histidine kinase KdpD [Chloroflexota bacterium]